MALSTSVDLTDELLKYQTINIDHITDNKCNRMILRQLMKDDPSLTSLTLSNYSDARPASTFNVTSVHEMAWLGYFIGKSTYLRELEFVEPLDGFDLMAKSFSKGASRNTSIEAIITEGTDNVFQMMGDQFFQCNRNLIEILVYRCPVGRQCINKLALTRSLKKVTFFDCQIRNDDYTGIMDALSGNTELEHLQVCADGDVEGEIGRNGFAAALLGLLKTSSKMKRLYLDNCRLNDEHIQALAPILKGIRLKFLSLVGNPSITSQGLGILSEALVGHATLEKLDLAYSNSIDDDVAIKFADALKKNTTLKTLDLAGNEALTEVGWSAFEDLLCSTSCIEKTFLSNHTLESLCYFPGLPQRYFDLVEMNENPNKKQVAMNKILKYHEDLDMTTLLEFGLGVLPAVVKWFDRAHSCPRNFEANTDKKKLSAIYQFIKGNPEAPEQHWSAMP